MQEFVDVSSIFFYPCGKNFKKFSSHALQRLLNIAHIFAFHQHMSDRNQHKENKGVLKKARPGRTRIAWCIPKRATIVGRAARTEEDVRAHDAKSVKSVRPKTAKRRERRWRHCSTLPFKPVTAFIPIQPTPNVPCWSVWSFADLSGRKSPRENRNNACGEAGNER